MTKAATFLCDSIIKRQPELPLQSTPRTVRRYHPPMKRAERNTRTGLPENCFRSDPCLGKPADDDIAESGRPSADLANLAAGKTMVRPQIGGAAINSSGRSRRLENRHPALT